IILMLDAGDRSTGVHLVRAGAQDFVIKSQIDCIPLAHTLRTAIERHRSLTALRAHVATDALTGLPNRRRFLASAQRDRQLAARLNKRWMMIAAKPGSEKADPHLKMLKAADRLRKLA